MFVLLVLTVALGSARGQDNSSSFKFPTIRWAENPKQSNVRASSPMETITNNNVTDCALNCSLTDGCNSFFHHNNDSVCQLIAKRCVEVSSTEISSGYKYYQQQETTNHNCVKDIEGKTAKISRVRSLILNGVQCRAFCDHTTSPGGWTVIQRRFDEWTIDFNRPWEDYVNGFGDPTGEYWLGLKCMHALTATQALVLRVDVTDFSGEEGYAIYDTFSVGDASTQYTLTANNYVEGNIGDGLDSGDSQKKHSGMKFSTRDKDNDKCSCNCATKYKGGFWFNDCLMVNVNGLYDHGAEFSGQSDCLTGIRWASWTGRGGVRLKRVKMMIRPRNV